MVARGWRPFSLSSSAAEKSIVFITHNTSWPSALRMLTSLAQCWSQAAHFTHTCLLPSLTADFQTWADHSLHGRGHETFLHPESGFSNALCQALEACTAFTTEYLRKSHFLTRRGLRYSCFSPGLMWHNGHTVSRALLGPVTATSALMT